MLLSLARKIRPLASTATASTEATPVSLYSGRGAELWSQIETSGDYSNWSNHAGFKAALSQLKLADFGTSIAKFDTAISLGCGCGAFDMLTFDLAMSAGLVSDPLSYVPVDASRELVARALHAAQNSDLPLEVSDGVACDLANLPINFEKAYPGRKLYLSLGNTLNNLRPSHSATVMENLARRLSSDDALLVDLTVVSDDYDPNQDGFVLINSLPPPIKRWLAHGMRNLLLDDSIDEHNVSQRVDSKITETEHGWSLRLFPLSHHEKTLFLHVRRNDFQLSKWLRKYFRVVTMTTFPTNRLGIARCLAVCVKPN